MNPLDALRPMMGMPEQLDQVQRGVWIHTTTPRPPVGLTPNQVIHHQNKLQVRFYQAKAPARKTPVVILPALINKAWICDLEPGRSLVAALAEQGHPTYLLDWGEAGPEDGEQDVHHYLDTLIQRSLDRICRHAGAQKAVVIGWCQGGVLAAMQGARNDARIAGIITINAPVDFEKGGRFADFCGPEAMDVDTALPETGVVPPEIMSVGFKYLDPMGIWQKYKAVDAASQNPKSLARVLARERWLEENVPIPVAFAKEWVVKGYQENRLLKGTWDIAGQPVDLKKVTVPTMVVACKNDFIAPPESVMPLADAVGSSDVEAQLLDIGHIGVVVGGFGPKVFYPMLHHWISRVSP